MIVWMKCEEFVNKVHVRKIVCPSRRGRLLGRWNNRVKEYIYEKGATKGGGQ